MYFVHKKHVFPSKILKAQASQNPGTSMFFKKDTLPAQAEPFSHPSLFPGIAEEGQNQKRS
jgi:hypothetical protein